MRYLIIILILLGCISCFQDKGNYDYRPANEVEISGIPEDVWIEKLTYVDTLRFEPEITSSLYEKGKEPYTYEWKLMGKTAGTTDTTGTLIDYTIARTKNLDYPLTLKSGDYCGFFWVKDTLTGVQKKQDFYLRLRSSVSDGWMVLCDENGEARLDMITYLTEEEEMISRNIWKDNDFKLGRPIKLNFSYRLQGSNRLVRTEKGTWNMDGETMAVTPDLDMNLMFGIPLSVVNMSQQVYCLARNSRADLMVMDDGMLYNRNPDDYGDIYGYPLNCTAESDGMEEFECAPFLAAPNGSYKLSASIIMYDQTNQCFREYIDDDGWYYNYPQELVLSSGTVSFDIYTGMDLLYMECTKDNYTFAVCGEESGKQYIYGIEHGEGGKNYPRYYMELKRTESDKILKYAFAPETRYLFYVTEKNEVYQYNLEDPSTPSKLVLTFPGEQITVLKFNKLVGSIAYPSWQRDRERMLIVGGYKEGAEESESGIMRMYEVPKLMQPLVLKKQWEDLGKIVDIVYREAGK